jgi:hypothetical protein
MTDHTMKAEGGASKLAGGDATMIIHTPLPPDHPMHSLVGQVASRWALVENFLDRTIWQLAKLDQPTGACLTAQITGSHARLVAIYALCLHQKKSDKILKQIRELQFKFKGAQDRRNRVLHDAWYVEDSGQLTEQFKSMARDEYLIGFHPVDEDFIKETLAKMQRRLEEVGALMNAVNQP